MVILPTHVFLTKGVGVHREKLASFEGALRDAGIAAFNLVRVSSIFPPHCRILPRVRGLKMLTPGQIAFVVMSDNATCEAHRLLSASVGIAAHADGRNHDNRGMGRTGRLLNPDGHFKAEHVRKVRIEQHETVGTSRLSGALHLCDCVSTL